MKKDLKHAELAFLSACQTATGDDKIPDEAVHLAAGILFAGYRTVIGTLWSIKDSHAPLVADEFYSHIVDPTTGTLNTQNAAYALHRAVGRLREEVGVKDFETWVPFIHLGV
jgi:CHAT domain-containing protein